MPRSLRGRIPAVLGRALIVAAMAALPAACAGAPPPTGPQNARITFEHRPVLHVDVAAIDYVEAWRPATHGAGAGSGAGEDIGARHANNPPAIARSWVARRLARAEADTNPDATAPGKGTLRVILREGSVVRTPLPVKQGVEGVFADEPDTRLEARLGVEVELVDPAAGRVAGISVTVTGAREILESASLNERDAAYFALMEQLAEAFDRELENGLRAELGFLLVSR